MGQASGACHLEAALTCARLLRSQQTTGALWKPFPVRETEARGTAAKTIYSRPVGSGLSLASIPPAQTLGVPQT